MPLFRRAQQPDGTAINRFEQHPWAGRVHMNGNGRRTFQPPAPHADYRFRKSPETLHLHAAMPGKLHASRK